MQALLADVRLGIRLILKNPGFAAIAILALALGIGANTALFTTVDAVLLRPLPYGEADRLAIVWEDASVIGFAHNTPSLANYSDWKKQNQVFAGMAATGGLTASLTGDGPPEGLVGRRVTPNFFPLLGTPAVIGRTLTDEDEKSGARVVVISYGLWQRHFGGDRNLVGREIQMNGESTTVVGVMPRGFYFPNRTADFWIPARWTPADLANRDSHFLTVVARLKPDVTMARAQNDLSAIAKRLEQEYPADNKQIGAVVVPIREEMAGNSRTSLWVLLGAAGCVLLIACANVANLLLAKAAGRQREMAIRSALGAERGRLIRQIVTESMLLSLLGGAAGLALASASIKLLAALIPQTMIVTLRIDPRVMLFALAISLLTGLLFGIAPALSAGRATLADALKQGGRGGTGARSWLRDALVVAEVAIALVLLVGAGLLIKTLAALQSLDVGFKSENLLTMRTRLPNPKYADAQKRLQYFDAVLGRVREIPGVEAAAFTSGLPFVVRGNSTGFWVQGREPVRMDALFRVTTSDYLKMMGIVVKEGRVYDDHDRLNTEPVIVINETFARAMWGNQSPLGAKMRISGGPVLRTVIGVISDIRERGLDSEAKAGMYLPNVQIPDAWAVPQDLVIRAKNPESLTAAARKAIWAVDPDQPISAVQTMDKILDSEVADRRQNMTLLASFAGLALLLASLGIYGVLSYAVTQRTREIGVRMALGAASSQVVRMIVRQGFQLAGAGLVVGAAVAFALSRAMTSILFGVQPADPVTFGATIAILSLVSIAACTIPAIRASRVDPLIALRDE